MIAIITEVTLLLHDGSPQIPNGEFGHHDQYTTGPQNGAQLMIYIMILSTSCKYKPSTDCRNTH